MGLNITDLPEKMQRQVREQLARDGLAPKVADATPAVLEPARATLSVGPDTDEAKLNKTERAFLDYLRIDCGWTWIGIQSITLKLGFDCRYTPDFSAIKSGTLTFFEVKGFWRDDARVKIMVAARQFRWAKFIAVQRIKKRWVFEEIRP